MKCSAAVSCTRHTTVVLHFTVLLHCSASPHSLDTQLSCALIDLTQLCSTPLHTMVHHHFSSHHHLSAKLCKFLRRCMQGIMVQHLKYGYICMLTALTSNWTLHSANWTTAHRRKSELDFSMLQKRERSLESWAVLHNLSAKWHIALDGRLRWSLFMLMRKTKD